MKDCWDQYDIHTYREGEPVDYPGGMISHHTRMYLRINRLGHPITSFRVEKLVYANTLNFPPYILIKYHKQWDFFAPLIVEYCVNDLKLQTIELDDMYDGN